MRQTMLGFCIFAAACSTQPGSPIAPSSGAGVIGAQPQVKDGAGVAGTQQRANSGAANVEVTFTKWIPTFPALAGVTGGDVPGTFAGEVLILSTTARWLRSRPNMRSSAPTRGTLSSRLSKGRKTIRRRRRC